MTIHAAKGLEFKNVIIVGLEEELFPSAMCSDSLAGIEEERRLFYVAITRAKNNCVITYATSRYKNGITKACAMSRFLRDIDPQYLQSSSTNFAAGNQFTRPGKLNWSTTSSTSPSRQRETRTTPLSPANNRTSDRAPRATTTSHVTPATSHSPQAASATDFSTHTVNELSEGCLIHHSRFGQGVITDIDQSGADAKITVDFTDAGPRTLLLKFARFKLL